MKLYLSIGTNQGDRAANISRALQMLDAAFKGRRLALSSIMETPSWGFEGEPFLNCAVAYEVPRNYNQILEQQALAILDTCKDIECKMGRTGAPEWDGQGRRVYHSRIIDIDILLYGRQRVVCPRLEIPHALMRQRDFVMVPLREIISPSICRAFPEIFETK